MIEIRPHLLFLVPGLLCTTPKTVTVVNRVCIRYRSVFRMKPSRFVSTAHVYLKTRVAQEPFDLPHGLDTLDTLSSEVLKKELTKLLLMRDRVSDTQVFGLSNATLNALSFFLWNIMPAFIWL